MLPPAKAALPQPSGTLVAPPNVPETRAKRKRQEEQLRKVLEQLQREQRKRDIEKRQAK